MTYSHGISLSDTGHFFCRRVGLDAAVLQKQIKSTYCLSDVILLFVQTCIVVVTVAVTVTITITITIIITITTTTTTIKQLTSLQTRNKKRMN